jgi:hypothetical protein
MTGILTVPATPNWLRPVAIGGGISAMLVIVNGFGLTAAVGPGGALAIWGGLIGVNMAGWLAWRHAVSGGAMTRCRLLLGAVMLNALLAIEVPLLCRLVGRADAGMDWRPFAYGLLVTGFVAGLKGMRPSAPAVPVDPVVPVSARVVPVGILARAGISDGAALLAVRAEDHYCRLSLQGGRSLLIHYRFRDAVSDLADLPGAQVHRSAWVADRAVTGGQREGRRWSLHLSDGSRVAVSETSVALCRARGWLRPVDGSA